jgi:hypothetical protein
MQIDSELKFLFIWPLNRNAHRYSLLQSNSQQWAIYVNGLYKARDQHNALETGTDSESTEPSSFYLPFG